MELTKQSVDQKESSSHDFPSDFYLRKRVRHQLEKIESDPEPNTQRQWREYELLRTLTRRLLKQAGFSGWAVGFALLCVVGFVIFALAIQPHGYVFTSPDNQWRVIREIDPYAFVLQHVYKGVAQPQEVRYFCKDYRPRLEAGMLITYFAFDDRGDCISIAPVDRKYVLLRDSSGYPVVPANCFHTNLAEREKDHIVCDGAPKFD